jgi:4-hydroxyproline epimerase
MDRLNPDHDTDLTTHNTGRLSKHLLLKSKPTIGNNNALTGTNQPSTKRSAAISKINKVAFLDSHTEGEPTRLILSGGPDLGTGSMSDRLQILRDRHDTLRTAAVTEPRGSDVIVGALLCEPVDPKCAAGVIFFNNVGYLGMCGHGTIGLIVSLAYLGQIGPGIHRIETPVGIVSATLDSSGYVTVHNVPSYRHLRAVTVEVPGHGKLTGDVAWGGNWFFLCEHHGKALDLINAQSLTEFAWNVRTALLQAGVTGANGAEIDHIELFSPSTSSIADSTNFVLCPGMTYDRSPCGTGTSAKLACLHADGKLAPGEIWRQQSIVGGVFEGSFALAGTVGANILPSIKGRAYVMAEGALLLDRDDPFRAGFAT